MDFYLVWFAARFITHFVDTDRSMAAKRKATAKAKLKNKSKAKNAPVKKAPAKKAPAKKAPAKKAPAKNKVSVKANVKPTEKPKTKTNELKKKLKAKTKIVTKKASIEKTPTITKPRTRSEKFTRKAKVATKKDATPKKTVEVKQRAPRPPPSAPRPRNVSTEPTVTPYRSRIKEEYMNQEQRAHFSEILLQWKMQLMKEVDRTVSHMKDEAANYPDPADRASQEEEFSLELKTRDRERKLIRKIDKTIELIEQDDYGYCESCGIEIGVQRLEARPTATQCIDCKTLDEIKERQIHG